MLAHRSAVVRHCGALFVGDLARILTLWTNAADTSSLNLLPVMASPVSAVDAHASWPFSRTTSTNARHADGIKDLPDVGGIAALTSRDKDGQWQAVPIYAKMDLAGCPAA